MEIIYWSLLILYLTFIHIVLFLLLWKPDFQTKLRCRLKLAPCPSYYNLLLTRHLFREQTIKPGSIAFIGDSLTQYLHVDVITPKAVNFGIAEDTTDGVLKRVPLYQSLKKAQAIVLMIGINDFCIYHRQIPEVFENYQKIIDNLPPHIPLLVCEMLPIREPIKPVEKITEKINDFNKELAKWTESQPERFYLVKAFAGLSDENRFLKAEYHWHGGVHLNYYGYLVWIDEVKKGFEYFQLDY